MSEQKNQEKCEICGEKLNIWNTPLKKYNGKTICSNCACEMSKPNWMKRKQKTGKEFDKLDELGQKMNKLGNKLIKGISIPIILFIIGLVTLPIGIIFWIIGLIIFLGVFSDGKTKKHKK